MRVRWLCGKVAYTEPLDIEWVKKPDTIWRCDGKVQKWSIIMRDPDAPDGESTLGINGVVGTGDGKFFASQGASVLQVAKVDEDTIFTHAVAALMSVPPSGPRADRPELTVAVVLDATKCSDKLEISSANKTRLQFLSESGFAEDAEEVLDQYAVLEDAVATANASRKTGGKRKPKGGRTSKKTTDTQETQTEQDAVGPSEGVGEKRKGKEKVARSPKKANKQISLGEALTKAQVLTTKTKEKDVYAMWKIFNDEIGPHIVYGQEILPHKVHKDYIHVAPACIKYREVFAARTAQLQREFEALGMTKRKPDLYCVPLKRKPVVPDDYNSEARALSLIVEKVPHDMNLKVYRGNDGEGGEAVPWYQDIHWFIIGGQHTYTAALNVAAREHPGTPGYRYWTEFNVIIVHALDRDMLVKLSIALNLHVIDKKAEETFRMKVIATRHRWLNGPPTPPLQPAPGVLKRHDEFRV